MKRTFALICVFLFAASLSIIPHANASSGLVESGISQEFKSEITYCKVLDDDTVLLVTKEGAISSNTLSGGILTPLWTFELNLTTTYAKIDSGQKVIAVIHDFGFLTFNIETEQVEQNKTLSSIPDSLDWDNDGDIWIAYHSGIRKAKEYRN